MTSALLKVTMTNAMGRVIVSGSCITGLSIGKPFDKLSLTDAFGRRLLRLAPDRLPALTRRFSSLG